MSLPLSTAAVCSGTHLLTSCSLPSVPVADAYTADVALTSGTTAAEAAP
jgi:hypothetical protein